MYLNCRGIDFFACWVMELFRQCGIVCFACQICLNCSTVCFFHYISLFYTFFSLVDICVYIWIIASSSNFSFHFVVSACDFQFVFTPIRFQGFICYSLFVLFFRYTVVVHDFHIRWYSCSLTVTGRVHSCSKNWYPLRSSSPVFIGVRLLNLPVSVLYFVHHCRSFCPCFFSHCIACRSTVYGF